jgi:Cu/Ag efflux protein CusF
MQKPYAIALAVALTFSGAAAVQSAFAKDTITPVAGSAEMTELTGEVVVVNTETRLMTIKTPDGTFEVIRIPPEVERIKSIKIGDNVTISQTEAVLVEIEKGRNAGAMGAIPEQSVEPEAGAKPAGTIVDKLTLYGKILDVDKAKSQVTVQGPNKTLTLKVEDPAVLDDLASGDGVIARYVRVITGKVE